MELGRNILISSRRHKNFFFFPPEVSAKSNRINRVNNFFYVITYFCLGFRYYITLYNGGLGYKNREVECKYNSKPQFFKEIHVLLFHVLRERGFQIVNKLGKGVEIF